jgi:dTDP-4-dehydrorhamnose 3,5-epimerase
MRFTQTTISGVWTIDPDFREDERGRFFRAWCSEEFAQYGISFAPVQANMGFSVQKGTLRGMHYQIDPAPEAKLVRCTRGAIFDVALDLRPDSQTFRQWIGIKLSAADGRMLLVPEGCAHGYQTLEDETEMHYMTSAVYTASAARVLRYDDPLFGIKWPLPATAVSKQDREWPLIAAHTATAEML